MRVPLQWLHEYVAPELSTAELASALDLSGTKVERIEHHGVDALDAFVVGHVLEVSQHPDADRLRVCVVDVGDLEPAQIVCGAPNVAAGQVVPVARPGAVMPDGTRLKAAKLRGIESQGMILAEDELAIGSDHAGIIVLAEGEHDGALAPGAPLGAVLPLATDVLELEITPNRPDCLGVYGVAREVHAATGAPLAPEPWLDDPGSEGAGAGAEVFVEVPDLCPRFTARVFEDVTIAPSPPWLKARLSAAGQRPINNVVDITNYAMLLTGQPLHAFDLDRVAGGRLVVRRARDGEQVATLDGITRTLDADMVVIDDADGPTSIAAVMGGARSEVSEATTRVLMEVANWNGPNIQRTSTKLGLRSEASGRFEKQLAPEQAMWGQVIATQLMLELTGARLVPGTIDVGGPGPAPLTIRLRESAVAGLLGAPIERGRQRDILTALNFSVADADDGLDVTVPPERREDVTREADLIEEVARIDGMHRLPRTLPARGRRSGLTPAQRAGRTIEDTLTARGLFEVVGWSFHGPDMADRLRIPEGDPRRQNIPLANPMSEEQSLLRTTLLGSLLDAARHNVSRGRTDVHLFEVGSVYWPSPASQKLPAEGRHVAALLTGRGAPRTWRATAPPPADFFAVKGALAGVLGTLRLDWALAASPDGPEPFLHAGRCAQILIDHRPAGWIGEVHPLVARAWDLDGAAAFELDLAPTLEAAVAVLPRYRDVTSFPEVREDLAVVVSDDVPAAGLLAVVREAGGSLLRSAEVFDVYRGSQVGDGKVSLALALEFAAPDRTLTDTEVAALRERIAAAIADELGGGLRA